MSTKIIIQGRQVLDIEANAILALKERLSDGFVQAVQIIKASKGKLILTGIGKSGQIARKLASTFSSTGTPSVFLHPAESAHGDLGIVESEDVILALSYGGETPELAPILAFALRKDIQVIAITGNINSTLAKAAKAVLNVSVSAEACPLNLAPTASSTASLAMGDAMAMAVLNEKGFSPEEFAEFHPGGSLGYRLLTRVKDVMHTGDALPLVGLDTPMRELFSIMTHKNVRGTAGVLDANGDLLGVITDGDIRRRLDKSPDPLTGTAKDLMTTTPRGVDANELAEKALFLMEQFRIQILFVFDKLSDHPKKPVGMLNFQDLLRTKIR
ncbi:MAG TPA: KpsF/GutQ family sugar-phosphate isomerase [Pseudobdellovibrionaceae bacterium]